MKIPVRLLILLLTFSILLIQIPAEATYIQDENVVILRSQYLEDPITLDGEIIEEAWTKAGLLQISLTDPKDVQIDMYFTNDDNVLYFAFEFNGLELEDNDSILLTFDVDGDGELNVPEDAIYVTSIDVLDYYFDGTNWVEDRSGGLGFEQILSFGGDFNTKFEVAIPLTAESVIYDGFRIASPSNTFIAFNLQYQEFTGVGNDEEFLFQFPTTPLNSTGYIDLKLAGPEDQDLPEFIPPEVVTDPSGSPPVNDQIDTIAGELTSLSSITFGIFTVIIISILHKRRDLY